MASLIGFDIDLRDKNGDLSFKNLIDLIRTGEDRISKSLPQHIKRSMVASRVYIQRECADEQILGDLLLTMQNMYIGWILTAMQLNTMVDSSRTVKQALDIIATEMLQFQDSADLIKGMENWNGGKMNVIIGDKIEGQQGGARAIEIPDKVNLPSGKIIEIKFNIDGNPKNQLSVNVFVQLMPMFIPDNVAEAFFSVNFKPSMFKRWFQASVGEIRFIQDFFFELDLLKKRNRARKDDKTGMLDTMMNEQRNGLFNFLLKLVGFYPEKQNIANAVHIYQKREFDEWCHKNGCNFKKPGDRNKYFSRTFSMMVAVIDASYEVVEVYIHGSDKHGEYKFDQLKSQAKNERYDLKSIMQAYYQSTAPKF
jgi:hypothetical protein